MLIVMLGLNVTSDSCYSMQMNAVDNGDILSMVIYGSINLVNYVLLII
jgi:hypothetical protein